MTDFTTDTSTTTARVDTRWRTSKFGKDHARPGTLDLSKFVDGTHYNIGGRTDNVVPSGVAVTKNAGTGLYEPWAPSANPETTPHPVLAGYINDDEGIAVYRRAGAAKSTKAAFALLVHGILDTAYLPIAGQASAVASAANTHFIYA